MVMSNQFDLIGDTDIDDPLQIALAQIEIGNKKPVSVAAPELPVKKTTKVASVVPHGGLPYQGRRGQDGPGRNFESDRYVNGFFPRDGAEGLPGKPSIRGHSDQLYRDRSGRGRGYLNTGYREHDGQPSRRQFDRRSGFSSTPEKVKGEPVPPVELEMEDKLPEQNLEENATLEGKSLISEEPVKLDNAPSSNANKEDKEGMMNVREEKEPEVEVMTLEEYEKILEKKRRTLVSTKTEARKVVVDKELESMQLLLVKKENNEFFIKLGNDKEAGKQRKQATERGGVEKPVSINEFLKRVKGERSNGHRGSGSGGDRGQARYSGGRRVPSASVEGERSNGHRGSGSGGDRGQARYSGGHRVPSTADCRPSKADCGPSIADCGQFPALGGGGTT